MSDSGILFVRGCTIDKIECLKFLLRAVKEINRRMLEHDFMLITSIAYGRFKYKRRIEFEGIEKNQVYGYAYVNAFLDNANGKPKIQPGQCRILQKNLPEDIEMVLSHNNNQDEILKLIKKRRGDNNHYYFYWMVNDPSEIDEFERQYTDAYNLKYSGMLNALKRFQHHRRSMI